MKLTVTKPTGLSQLSVPPRALFGPGPSNAHPRVLLALGMRQIGHLDPKFLEIMNENQALLRYTFQTENSITIPVSGCGSASMESTFANLVEPGDNLLILNAGYFALRMKDMAERYGGVVQTINKPWGSKFDLDEVKAAVEQYKPKILCAVHADTSTGARQPLEGFKELCEANDCLLLVDTVTSLGGVPLFVDQWGIDACYSGSQKCLSCPPGIAPLTMSDKAMDKVLARKTKVANWYLDLTAVKKYWGKERTYHHTAPINMNYALREALLLIAEEGLEERWARHQTTAKALWDGLKEIGLECYVDEEYRLPSLTAVTVPEGVNAKDVTKFVLAKYNIEIGNGLGELGGKIWRIGMMGFNSRLENVTLVIAALKDALEHCKADRSRDACPHLKK